MIRTVIVRKEEANRVALQELSRYLKACKDNNDSVLLCLSGGSALNILEGFPSDVLGEHVTVTVLDERYSTDSGINNMAQIASCGFLEKALAKGCKVIDTRVRESETLEEVVTGYNIGLSRWIENNPKGKIVVTAGMGPDGHTAGIIPGSDNFDALFGIEQRKLVVGYTAINQPEIQKTRITTTFAFLKRVAYAVLLILGENKAEAIQRLLASEGSLSETPARIWRSDHIETVLVTDLRIGVGVEE